MISPSVKSLIALALEEDLGRGDVTSEAIFAPEARVEGSIIAKEPDVIFTIEDFAVLHPGGRLGKKLVRVEDVMHGGDLAPRVRPETAMKDVLFEMTKKRLGMTTVVDDQGRLLGMISDGDLRRHMEKDGYALLDRTAAQCMTARPLTIRRRELATAALAVLEERKITSLPVVDETGVVEGVVHLHDLWKTQMI